MGSGTTPHVVKDPRYGIRPTVGGDVLDAPGRHKLTSQTDRPGGRSLQKIVCAYPDRPGGRSLQKIVCACPDRPGGRSLQKIVCAYPDRRGRRSLQVAATGQGVEGVAPYRWTDCGLCGPSRTPVPTIDRLRYFLSNQSQLSINKILSPNPPRASALPVRICSRSAGERPCKAAQA